MSGIFGILRSPSGRGGQVPESYPEIMRDALRHLGADGSSVLSGSGVTMGHLATHITPESVNEQLPFKTACGRYMMTGSMRIDNRGKLIKRLGLEMPGVKIIPDSRIVFAAYKKWGSACPDYLEGEFAFAIWDNKDHLLFCANDPISLRPFFYVYREGIFAFSSQMKGLLSLPFVPAALNEYRLAGYLRLPVKKYADRTLYKSVKKLNSSHSLTLRNGSITVTPYWTPRQWPATRYRQDEPYAETLRNLLAESIRRRLRVLPEKGIGIALSGGLDSSSIACIAARELKKEGRRLTAFCGVLPRNHSGIEKDERRYIREVLKQETNIDAVYVTPGDTGPFDHLETIFNETSRPAREYHYLHRALWHAARERNVKLMFYGEGGDHMASYKGTDSLARLVLGGRFRKAFNLGRAMASVQGVPFRAIIRTRIISHLLPDRLRPGVILKKDSARKKRMTTAAAGTLIRKLGLTDTDFNRSSPVHYRYPDLLLEKIRAGRFPIAVENIRMSHFGLFGLYPFLDKKIIEFCLSVPPEQFIAGGFERSLLRRAMEGILPPLVQWRQDKAPFSPDFHRRVKNSVPGITGFIESMPPGDPVHNYIDIHRIQRHIKEIRPARGRQDWNHRTANIVVRGIIALKFLKWLETRS